MSVVRMGTQKVFHFLMSVKHCFHKSKTTTELYIGRVVVVTHAQKQNLSTTFALIFLGLCRNGQNNQKWPLDRGHIK